MVSLHTKVKEDEAFEQSSSREATWVGRVRGFSTRVRMVAEHEYRHTTDCYTICEISCFVNDVVEAEELK